ncbi:hypothetical protein NNJEOMEG_03706 [Fundidesulfovibrio magnetotacticus]|uniref:Uncharacterized protein n=1 Tax=Fundidesulfovibrio magnetotacticus TaxID=2730080 RepID=A0A6V8M5J5_9BACT|nr:hypothetical protein [Fundidesulfovibrio magnetotacticus]GFK95835.1 hypothetical protein NNJEOMEG_03706 [Fundidesulfovibrio magnetotacticus]
MRPAVILLALALAACQGSSTIVIPQDASSLDHFALGLRYKQEGRYLLAREHFQLAKATARDMDLERRCDSEIDAADRALKALR